MKLYDVVTFIYGFRYRVEARVPGTLAIKIAKRWNVEYGSETWEATVEAAQANS